MTLPIHTQISPNTEPVIHWGVHFVYEDVVSNYGPGEEAKAAAEEAVKSWADSPYPAKLVSQTIMPWTTVEQCEGHGLIQRNGICTNCGKPV